MGERSERIKDSTSGRVRRVAKAVLPGAARKRVYELSMRLRFRGDPIGMKREEELRFWHEELVVEGGRFYSDHIHRTFTDAFGLDGSFYEGARILDVGCGPVGSLEWASASRLRLGLDPLTDSYRELGIGSQAMRYVAARAEQMPFPDASFDVVSTFNSLDHVDDLAATVAEVQRVVKPGGTVLVMVEVNHPPTLTEPLTLTFDVLRMFEPTLRVVDEKHLDVGEGRLYEAALAGRMLPADHGNPPAGLLARLEKPTTAG